MKRSGVRTIAARHLLGDECISLEIERHGLYWVIVRRTAEGDPTGALRLDAIELEALVDLVMLAAPEIRMIEREARS